MFYDSKIYVCLLVELMCFVFIIFETEIKKTKINRDFELKKQLDAESIEERFILDAEFRYKFDKLLRNSLNQKKIYK